MKDRTKPHITIHDHVWLKFRQRHNITLKEEHLQTIDETYKDVKLGILKDLGMYRFVNLLIALIITGLFFVANSFNVQEYFFIWVFCLFVFSNLISLIDYLIKYRKLKKQSYETPNNVESKKQSAED